MRDVELPRDDDERDDSALHIAQDAVAEAGGLDHVRRPEGYVETFDHTQPHPESRIVTDEEIAAADGITTDESAQRDAEPDSSER